MDPYDTLPYESIAFPESHPGNLAVLGRLFGLDTADPACCRVLELGCASGGNLVPMAWRLPNSSFLGIDLSQTQIEAGLALTHRLELPNIELRQGDILELNEGVGEFDYLIAHGVYSWVPPKVREHLIGIARHLLAPDGLFYVSYNTLPGWRMRGMLRDILRHGCRHETTPSGRLAAAQSALERLDSAIGNQNALSSRLLREEIAHLRDEHPSYLLFEYLAEYNQAFLFSDFAADVDRHQLRYLCDTDLRTLFPSTYGEAVDKALADLEDGLELEQWLDFVTNRSFRQSVLCRADASLENEIDLDRFATLSFCADLSPPGEPVLGRIKNASFTAPNGNQLWVSHPLTKLLLIRLTERYPDCLPLGELMPDVIREVATTAGGALASQANECLSELFSLYAHGGVNVRPQPLRLRREMTNRPRASALAIARIQAGARQIPTVHHGNLDLDAFAAELLLNLNGTRTHEELAERLARNLLAGDLAPPPGVQPRSWSHERLRKTTRTAVRDLLALFARYGVLE